MRESKIHGLGLFAIADIAKDEIVPVKGGHIVDGNFAPTITLRLGPLEIQIDDDLFIAPVSDGECELSMLYSNHSCNANLGLRGKITFVATRDVQAGEELTPYWAFTNDCGAPDCRKSLTGKDWQRWIAEALLRLFFRLSCAKSLFWRCSAKCCAQAVLIYYV